ncbi:unnamed protein product [Closterium sp. NIES-64]|nr:unnamed protein product [Closterium sp. NIES-64]
MASPTTPSLLHQSQLPNTPPHIGPPESRSQPSAPHDNAPSRKFLLPYPVSPPTSRAIASPANSLSSLEQPRDLLSLSRQASHPTPWLLACRLPLLPRLPCTLNTYHSDMTMSLAEEEALGTSGEDLAVDSLPEGMFHQLAKPTDLPRYEETVHGARLQPRPQPFPLHLHRVGPRGACLLPHAPRSRRSHSAPDRPGVSAGLSCCSSPQLLGHPRNSYASVDAGSTLAPALPISLFASPNPGAPPRNLRRARTDAAPSLLFPLRRRVVVTVLLPKAGLESYRSEILAGINAQLCGFMFASGIIPSVEQTVGDPYRVARRVYGRLLFSWPSQEDAAAFRKLFPLTLKVSNSRPLLLKVFEDRFAAFTAAKAAGAPTLSIRNIPLDFDPEDIHAYLLGSTKSDGSH